MILQALVISIINDFKLFNILPGETPRLSITNKITEASSEIKNSEKGSNGMIEDKKNIWQR